MQACRRALRWRIGVRQASFEADEDPKGLSWSDFSFDNMGKTAKKLTGQGAEPRDGQQSLIARRTICSGRRWRPSRGRRPTFLRLAAPKYAAAADRWPDSQLAMDALFMAGECYFFADNYPQANLTYEKLVKAFPNNRYLDTVDQRRFAIARYWLDSNRAESRAVLLCQLVQQDAAVARRPRPRPADVRQDSHRRSDGPAGRRRDAGRRQRAFCQRASSTRPTSITPTCGRPIPRASTSSWRTSWA